MTHQQELADRIAQLRREKSAAEHRDVLQDEIAEACGVSTVTYSRYEGGKRKVPEEIIQALAVFYGRTAWFIRYGVEIAPERGQLSAGEIAEARRIRDAEEAATPAADLPHPRRRRGTR